MKPARFITSNFVLHLAFVVTAVTFEFNQIAMARVIPLLLLMLGFLPISRSFTNYPDDEIIACNTEKDVPDFW